MSTPSTAMSATGVLNALSNILDRHHGNTGAGTTFTGPRAGGVSGIGCRAVSRA